MAAEKFKELILYIAQESEFDPNFGVTKLNKILFFCDFLAYRKYRKSISDQRYFKLQYGPAPRALLPALAELVADGTCIEIERNHYGRRQKRILVKDELNLEILTATEVALVASVIRTLWDNSAREVSDLSHHFIGWQLAEDQEDIPFDTIFMGDPGEFTPTAEEITYAQELDREELGLNA